MLQGYNATIFAYGQTGTGKTHTMIGGAGDSRGVIPRAVQQILQHVSSDPTHTYSVQVAFLQLYMEMLQDLLDPSKDSPIRIREDPEEGVYLSGIRWVPVTTVKECMELMALGDRHRNTAFTSMNSHSSRSHAAFMIKLEKRVKYSREQLEELERSGETPDQSLIKSVLYLVDLAGSERVKKSKAVGSRLDEAKNINLALLALGNCIQALADKKAKFVPFRDSKLTRLLEDSLGGNSKTSLIVTVGPSSAHANETISSLQFGSRAMKVENRPEVNKIVDYRSLCSQLQAELDQVNDGHSEYLIHNQQLLKENEELRAQVEKLTAEKEELMTVLDDVKRQMEAKGSVDVTAIEAQKKAELQKIQQHFQAKVQKQDEEHRKFLEEIDKLILDQERDSAQMKAQISQHKNEKAKLTKELAKLQQELERERTDRDTRIAQVTQEMEDLRSRLSAAEEAAITQKGICTKLQTTVQERESALKALSTHLEEAKATANTEVQALKQQLQASVEEQKRAKQTAAEKKVEWENKVKASIEELGRKWQAKLDDLKAEATQRLAAKEQDKRELETQLKAANTAVAEKEATVASLRRDLDLKGRESMKLLHVSEALKQELDKLMSSCEGMKAQLAEARTSIAAKEGENADLVRKCMQRDEQIEDCLAQVRDREKKLAEVQTAAAASSAARKQLEEDLAALASAHELEKSSITEKFTQQIGRLQAEGQRQVAQIEDLERKHKTIVESLGAKHSTELQEVKVRLEAERRKLTDDYNSSLQQSELRHQAELKETQSRAETDIGSLRRQLQALSTDSDSRVEDLREELQRQRNSHIAEIETMAKQHNSAIAALKEHEKSEVGSVKRELEAQLVREGAKFESRVQDLVKKHGDEVEKLRETHAREIANLEERLESSRSESTSRLKSAESELHRAEQQHLDTVARLNDECTQVKSALKNESAVSERLKSQVESLKKQLADLQTELKALKQREVDLIQKQRQELAFMHDEHTQSTRQLEAKHTAEKAELEKYWEAQLRSTTDLHQQQIDRTSASHQVTVHSLNKKVEALNREKDEIREKAKADDQRREDVINGLRLSQQSLMEALTEREKKAEEDRVMHETQVNYLQGNIEALTAKLHQERDNATNFECKVDVLKMEKAQIISEMNELQVKLSAMSQELVDLQASHDDELRELYEAARLRGEAHEAALSDCQRTVSWYLMLALITEVELRAVSEDLEDAQRGIQQAQETSFSSIKSLEDAMKVAENHSKAQVGELQVTIAQLRREKEDCVRVAETLQNRLEGKEIELRGLETQLDATRDTSLTQSAELSGRLKELQRHVTTKDVEIHSLRTELQSHKERNAVLIKKQTEDLIRLESEISAKNAEAVSLTLELDRLKEASNAQIVKATERLTQLQQSLRAKDGELSQIALKLKQAEETANTQAEELTLLRRSMAATDSENRQLQVKVRSLEQTSEVFRQEKVKQVADLNLQLREKDQVLKSREALSSSLATELDSCKSSATEVDLFLRSHLSQDFDLISWLKRFLKEHKQSQAGGQFEFLSYLCNVYNKLQSKGVDALQVHEFSRTVHDKFFEHTRTQVSNPKVTRYFENSLTTLEREMEISKQSGDLTSGSLRDISIRQQEAMKKKLKKAGRVQRDTVNCVVEHLVLLTEIQGEDAKAVKGLLEARKRQCEPIFTWEQLKTCSLSQLAIPADPSAEGILSQVISLKRLAMSLTALLCVSSSIYSCMLTKSLHQEWVAEDRAELIVSLVRAYEHARNKGTQAEGKLVEVEREKEQRLKVEEFEQQKNSAARLIQRRWRFSKKREIKHKAEIYEEQSKQLNTQLSQVSVQNGYLLIKANFADVCNALNAIATDVLDPASDG